MSRNHDQDRTDDSAFRAPTACGELAPLLTRAAVETLDTDAASRVAGHLVHCERCRREAVELGEFVANLRTMNESMGGPSRRFEERLATRLAIERDPTRRRSAGFVGTPGAPGNSPRGDAHRRGTPAPATSGAGDDVFVDAFRERTTGRSESNAPGASRSVSKRSLWLILAVSLLVNAGWLATLARSRSDRAIELPNSTASGTQATPIALKAPGVVSGSQTPAGAMARLDAEGMESVRTRLQRLRNAVDGTGLLGGDPVATAWWLVAEARARQSGLTREMPPASAVIEQAQVALAGTSFIGEFDRSLAILGIRESHEALGVGRPAEILATLNRLRRAGVPDSRVGTMRVAQAESSRFGDTRMQPWRASSQVAAASPKALRPEAAREGSTSFLQSFVLRDTSGTVAGRQSAQLLIQAAAHLNADPATDLTLPMLARAQIHSPRGEAACAVAALSMTAGRGE